MLAAKAAAEAAAPIELFARRPAPEPTPFLLIACSQAETGLLCPRTLTATLGLQLSLAFVRAD
jgi:hypothetical protein